MKTCMTHIPGKPIIIHQKQPCFCQGLCLMREFRIKHAGKKCEYEEIPGPSYKTEDFVTGSSYDGEWRAGCGMQGHGVYMFPNGVIYEGEFNDGAFHGEGELRYQTKAGKIIIQGQWKNDVLIKRKLIFEGSVEYDENDWKYCKIPDRRYAVEYDEGLQPTGNSFLTSHKPPIAIPPGCYDVGDGVYDPEKRMVFNYDMSKSFRRPSVDEQRWIIDNCRIGQAAPLGPRPEIYETFLQPNTQPIPEPQPEVKSKLKGSRDYIG